MKPRITIDHVKVNWERDSEAPHCEFVQAVAEVSYPINEIGDRRLQTFTSGGLSGVERPSTDYRAELEREELDDLRAHLAVFGIDESYWPR